MASRNELLGSISYDMRLDKSFFMKIYGYELTCPGFANQALSKLEECGCSRATEYYNDITFEWQQKHDEMLKCVAEEYRKQCDREYEKKVTKIKNAERNEKYQFNGLPQDW